MLDGLKIRISSEADLKGFDQVEAKLKESDRAASEFLDTLKAGVGIDLGGKIVSGIQAIPEAFKSAIAEGVRFNAQIESAQLGIAALFRQFQGQKFTTFDEAIVAADKAVEALKAKAATTNVTFEQLLGSYQAASGKLFAAGVTDLQKQVDLVALLANAVSAVVSDKSQLLQETKAIITGNITADAQAANVFGITAQDIKTATEAGNLVDFLQAKLGTFAEAGERGANTLDVAFGNFKEQLTTLFAEVSKPVFEELKTSIALLATELNKGDVQKALKDIGADVAEIVHGGAALTKWALENADAMTVLAKAVTGVVTAMAALKLATIAGGLFRAGGAAAATTAGAGTTAATTAAGGAAGATFGATLPLAGLGIAGYVAEEAIFQNLFASYDQNEASTRAKIEAMYRRRANRNFGRQQRQLDFRNAQNVGAAAPGETDDERKRRLAALAAEMAPVDLSPTAKGQDALGKAQQDALLAGIDPDALLALKQERSQNTRGILALQLGLPRDFNAQQALDASTSQGGNEADQKAVADMIRQMAIDEADLAKAQQESAEYSDKAAAEAKKRADAIDEARTSLREELAIEQAKASGNVTLQRELEKERSIREEIAKLTKDGISAEEARASATELVTARMAAQDAQNRKGLDDLKPTFGDELNQGGGRGARRRRAARNEFAAKVDEEIAASGLTGDAAAQARAAKLSQYDQARADAQGRTLVSTGFANPNNNVGGGLGIAPSADFLSLQPLANRIPLTAANAPQTGAKEGAGQKLEGAANSQQNAATQTASAATALKGAADTLATAMETLKTAATNLEARMKAVEGQQGK